MARRVRDGNPRSNESGDGQSAVWRELDATLRDLRYGANSLWRAPGFTVIVLLTLTLGIGASVAVFSVMRSVLWRPLPYPDADRIVTVTVDVGGIIDAGAAHGEILDLRAQSQHLSHISTTFGVDAHVSVDGAVERVAAASATDDVLPLLGAAPALGRLPQGKRDDAAVMGIAISSELWHRRFGSDPSTVGRRVQINNRQMEIVGVLRPGLRVFLPASSNAATQIDVWFPMNVGRSRESRGFALFGRLLPGVTMQQAQAELDTLAVRFARDQPQAHPQGPVRFRMVPLRQAITRNVRGVLGALGAAVGFVLLIACANVANLMLARNKARETELALRKALGAGTGRLLRQLFTESLPLGALGALGGLVVGYLGLHLIAWLRPVDLPRQSEIAMDGTVVALALALSVLTSVAFGLLPALWQTWERRSAALAATRSHTSSVSARQLQSALVIAEVAVSIIPLVAAGLMLRTFANLVSAPIGFDPSGLQTAKVALSFRQYPDVPSRWAFHRDLLGRIGQLPGVTRVTAASPLPFAPLQETRRYGRDGDDNTALSLATQQTTLPGYLAMVQTHLREGRDFTEADTTSQRPVVIIDERIAQQLWPEGAIGKRLIVESGQRRRSLEVIGVANAVRSKQVRDDQTPNLFVPYHVYPIELSLVIATGLSATAIAPAIERTVAAMGTGRAVFDVRPMSDNVADALSETRFTMLVLGGFAAAALALAAIGLYGTLSYLISQRMREFGVRVALGATVQQIMAMVLRQGLTMSVVGAGLGLLGALAVTRLMAGLLYDVRPFDAVTMAAVAALVVLVALLAAGRPAWRAARVDSRVVLRSE